MPLFLAVFIMTLFLVGSSYYFFPLAEVIGDSMYPTFKNGQIILCSRFIRKSKLIKGEVYVFKHHTEDKVVIKRLTMISDRGNYFIEGDNSEVSCDSRHFGYVSPDKVVAKVIRIIK